MSSVTNTAHEKDIWNLFFQAGYYTVVFLKHNVGCVSSEVNDIVRRNIIPLYHTMKCSKQCFRMITSHICECKNWVVLILMHHVNLYVVFKNATLNM